MKKTVSSLTLILIGLFVVLSLLDIRGDYAVEEILWNANKRLSDAARTPEAVPDKVFEEIIAQYQRVIKGFPDSKLVPKAFIFLGRAYLVKKDYSTARQRLREVIGRFPKDDVNCVEALSAIGSSYELQGNWPEALKVYYEIKNDYPLTDLGLSVPLYIANHYTKNQQAANAISAFDAAESYYTQMADGHSNTPIEFKSLTLLSNCLLAQKKWTDAINTMGRIIIKFPSPNIVAPTMKTINAIALTQIKDFDGVIAIYQDFLEKHPKSPLNKTVQQMIQAFKGLKGKNIKVTEKVK